MKTLHAKCPLPSHPLADELPMLDKDRAADFRKTIEVDGKVHTPIVIVRKGANIGLGRVYDGPDAIITGRQRTVQALELGIPWEDNARLPKRDFDLAADGPTIENFVLREDVHGRRHLDDPARAIIAANLAKQLQAELEKGKKDVAAADAAASSAVKGDKPAAAKKGDNKRPSHEARKQAAKTLNVSEDSVKKAQLVSKHDDLAEKLKAKKITLDAAYKQATERRDAAKAKSQAEKIQNERKDSILYLRNTFGEKSLFVGDVIKRKVFGDERHGHRDLMLFVELPLANQRAVIPLLMDRKTLKEANEVYVAKDVDQSWSVEELIHRAVVTGLGPKTDSKTFEVGEFKVTVTTSKDNLKRLEQLVTKSS